MPLYFSDTAANQDPTDPLNWWTGAGATGSNGNTPSVSDDCTIDPGHICSSSSFDYNSLVVQGTLTSNPGGKTVLECASGGTITTNAGTVTTNNGTIDDNQSVVVTNNNIITTRTAGGSTTNEYQAADIPANYTVTNLNVGISVNDGIIGTLAAGYNIGNNNGPITTVSATASVSGNYSTITSNSGTIVTNFSTGTITTNQASGIVQNNQYGAVITSNLGTVRIGTITGGTGALAANAATNLASHTAGTNVTLPSGNTTWW